MMKCVRWVIEKQTGKPGNCAVSVWVLVCVWFAAVLPQWQCAGTFNQASVAVGCTLSEGYVGYQGRRLAAPTIWSERKSGKRACNMAVHFPFYGDISAYYYYYYYVLARQLARHTWESGENDPQSAPTVLFLRFGRGEEAV